MRLIVHLSDLHFGALRAEIIEPLIAAVTALHPDLIAVSGDLTQRARPRQFIEAREFLARLSAPQIVVAGNHDVPLYNLLQRFGRPLARYRRYISAQTEPMFRDDEIAVLGINTARSLTFKSGRVNARQLAQARERLAPLAGVSKIIVTHHPFDLPAEYPDHALVGRARLAMAQLAHCGIDLFLAGHHHVGLALPSTLRFKVSGHAALLVQAGTATSTRCRGEMNSFNVLRVAGPLIEVERQLWLHDGAPPRFVALAAQRFCRSEKGWEKTSVDIGAMSQKARSVE